MFAKKPPTSFTLNARDQVPDPPGHEISHDLRPPPKVYYPYRDCNGISPKQIEKMIRKKKEYEEECERIQTENDIAKFEAKLKGKYVETPESNVPSLPIPPDIDLDLLRSFEPPSATRFYDYAPPNTSGHSTVKKVNNCGKSIKSASRPSTALTSNSTSTEDKIIEEYETLNGRPHTSCMSRGCACCNPKHLDELKARTRPATRNGKPIHRPTSATPRKKANIPLQMNQAYWNVLDEPSVPSRPKNVYVENRKQKQFSMLRTGPRPGGIPICVSDLIASREAGEKWFEIEMGKKKDMDIYKREKILHERSKQSRNFNLCMREHTQEIGMESKQKWAKASHVTKVKPFEDVNKKKVKQPSKDDLEAMEELSRYDDKLYQEYQEKKRPTDDIELFLHQCAQREYK